MPKKIKAKIKLQIPGGQATPAPPVGPALGQHGLNIADFTQKFNQQTEDRKGLLLPVLITVYEDRTFDFVVKSPAAAFLLKKAAKIDKGASETGTEKVGSVTPAQIKEIAEQKMADLSAHDLEAACQIIEGTARSMGIEVK